MKNILEKMIYAAGSCAMLIAVVFTLSSSGLAQNHNPEFSVSNTFIGGEPYIFIGENDGEVFEPRTPVGLQLRNPPDQDEPYNGSTTLQWSQGSSGVLAFDEDDSMTGFKEEDETGDGDTGGSWTWTDGNQANFHGDTVFLQGSASAEPGTVTLESFHSEDPDDKFTKDFRLLKVDLEVNGTSTVDDDVVRKSTNIGQKNYRDWVSCNLSVDPSAAIASLAPLTLSSTSSRVKFYKVPEGGEAPGSNTAPASTITLNQSDFSSNEATFYICGGDTVSSVIGDAKIDVTSSSISGFSFQKDVTVYWFDSISLTAAAGGNYTLDVAVDDFNFAPPDGVSGVTITGAASITPTGLNCNAAPLSNLRLTYVQNVRLVETKVTFDNPRKTKNSSLTASAAPEFLNFTYNLPNWTLDYSTNTQGFDGPFINNSSMKPPVNCPNGGNVVFDDTPRQNGTDLAVVNTGDLLYDIHSIDMNFMARTWLIATDITDTSQEFVPIAQHDWTMDINRELNVTSPIKKITPSSSGASIPPANRPVTSNGPYNSTQSLTGASFSGPQVPIE